ncbi:hypothetical protein BOS5A_210022 [Bosea sp. EC-HK365B]|nr:hypothetical protein BOSE7B_140021 [Bosea sp. 7B]CAD5272658.1 hypothetical protein BOSE21B_20154 [Bosea sp. 21B]VVT59231.1 hypothetical protein BOS5A_210022 [Bosea sp. EC-HK365B]VXC24178.1 hypothetical protein BOSE127_170574 [Bosea sp. 127]
MCDEQPFRFDKNLLSDDHVANISQEIL